jgi:hypothetical protein
MTIAEGQVEISLAHPTKSDRPAIALPMQDIDEEF